MPRAPAGTPEPRGGGGGTGRHDGAAGSDLEEHHQPRCHRQRRECPVHRPNVAPAPQRVNRGPVYSPLRWSLVTATDTAAARARLLEIIKEKAIVHGRVTLSSGKEADYYVDLRRISLDGEAAPLIGIVMRELTKDLSYAAVGGLTLGADPVATSMLHAPTAAGARLAAFVGRKSGKAHGLQQRIEGPSIKGRRVLVVEDTTTTGASPLAAVDAAREDG